MDGGLLKGGEEERIRGWDSRMRKQSKGSLLLNAAVVECNWIHWAEAQ